MLLLAACVGYLLGSFPTGYLIGRARGIDVRRFGSGATGGTNVLRTLGWGPALLTAAGDVAKGTLAAWAGTTLAGPWGFTVAGLAAMLGHSFPAWIRWRGGKAVGTAAGALLFAHPAATGLGLAMALALILPTRYVSLGSLGGAAVIAVYLLLRGTLPLQVFGVGALVLVAWLHRANIGRLQAGTEHRVGQSAAPRPGERDSGRS